MIKQIAFYAIGHGNGERKVPVENEKRREGLPFYMEGERDRNRWPFFLEWKGFLRNFCKKINMISCWALKSEKVKKEKNLGVETREGQ